MEALAPRSEDSCGETVQGFAQLSWSRNDQGFHLVDGLGANLYSRGLRALEYADHFHFALARLERGASHTVLHHPGRHFRIGGVALPLSIAG